jgi:hypothetical protein
MRGLQHLLNFAFALAITWLILAIIPNLTGIETLNWYHYAVIFLASYPWKIGDNIYSLFGGINMDGVVNSLIGIIQIAEDDANSFLGIIQISLRHNTNCAFGISVIQISKNYDTNCFFGVSLLQIADEKAYCMAGISILQIASAIECKFGIPIFQLHS